MPYFKVSDFIHDTVPPDSFQKEVSDRVREYLREDQKVPLWGLTLHIISLSEWEKGQYAGKGFSPTPSWIDYLKITDDLNKFIEKKRQANSSFNPYLLFFTLNIDSSG